MSYSRKMVGFSINLTVAKKAHSAPYARTTCDQLDSGSLCTLLFFLALLGDHQVLDLVVGSLGNDAFGNQVVLAAVRPARHDLFRIRVSDAGQFFELDGSRAVQIHQSARLGGSLGRRC